MKKIARYIASKTLQPAVKKYISKTRVYRYKHLILRIPPGVFHPAFFFSTKILLHYVIRLPLKGRQLLELGAGSGLISFVASGKEALVTASDINPVAIENLKLNSANNGLPVKIILSDIFDKIPLQQFDVIIINPPYYRKTPKNYEEFAWYCGENGEYFEKLFAGLHQYTHIDTLVLMILSDDCDIQMVKHIAAKHCFIFEEVLVKNIFWEKNFIFKITFQNPGCATIG